MPSHLDSVTYVLDAERKPVQHANDDAWWRWFNVEDNRRVAKTTVGDVWISTVFIGVDLLPPPNRGKLFETQVFGGEHSRERFYAATWEEAQAQHARIVALVERGQ